jgi:CrcB protein
MNNLFIVFIGGGAGCLARYGVALLSRQMTLVTFPVATLISNTLSCLIVALAFGVFSERVIAQPSLRLLVITGFCGGFSTFSAFSLETVQLARDGHFLVAAINILVSLSLCFGVIFLFSKNN